MRCYVFFFFQAEDGIRDLTVTGVQTCALPICRGSPSQSAAGSVHGDARGPQQIAAANLDGIKSRVVRERVERSEERRVGEEGRSRWSPDHLKKKRSEDGGNVLVREIE